MSPDNTTGPPIRRYRLPDLGVCPVCRHVTDYGKPCRRCDQDEESPRKHDQGEHVGDV